MTHDMKPPLSKRFGRGSVEDQAVAWCDALIDGNDDPALCEAFERWRAEPAHAQAYERIRRAYSTTRAAVGSSQQLMAMENEILARAATQSGVGRRRFAAAIAAALVLALVAGYAMSGGSWQELQYLKDRARYALAGDTLYRTAVGERLVVSLEDGSVLTLNTDSRALVQYHDGVRGVALMNGQALFQVAKDPSHPFVVTAGGRRVTALGTAFDVRVDDRELEVTLIEGRVTIEPEARGEKPRASLAALRTELTPGEQLVVSAKSTKPVVRKTNVERTISWRDGQIIFDNDTLAYAVGELNRYGKRKVVLTDDRLAGMHVSGAFDTSNTGVFIDMLTAYLPVRVVEADDDRVVLGYRGG